MKNYVLSGKVLTLVAPYNVLSGGGMKVGSIIGVANGDALSGADVEASIEGVFDMAKDSSTFSQGAAVYWDDTNKVMTSTTSGNTKCGVAVQAQVTGDATVRVRLNASF